MLKTKSKILVALFLILFLVSSYCFATIEPRTAEPEDVSDDGIVTTSEQDAMPIAEENTPSTEEENDNSWTNSDLFTIEDKVTISKVIDGNAYVIGKEVTITGEIGGDLFVVADKLTIDGGYIYSNVFACANEITINGVVYDLYATCKTLTLGEDGFVYRDMRAAAGTININGRVRRNAFVATPNLNFAENGGTFIYGNLKYSSENEATIPTGAVQGKVDFEDDDRDTKSIGSYISDLLKNLFFTFIVAVVLLWLTPKFVERVSDMSVGKSFTCLGIGVLTPIAFIFAAILLLISVIGLPIAIVGILAFVILVFVGNAIANIYFGKLFTKLLKLEGNVNFVLITLGSCLVLWVIGLIPFVGGLVSFLVKMFGIGAVLVNLVVRKEKVEKNVEEKVAEKIEEKPKTKKTETKKTSEKKATTKKSNTKKTNTKKTK